MAVRERVDALVGSDPGPDTRCESCDFTGRDEVGQDLPDLGLRVVPGKEKMGQVIHWRGGESCPRRLVNGHSFTRQYEEHIIRLVKANQRFAGAVGFDVAFQKAGDGQVGL